LGDQAFSALQQHGVDTAHVQRAPSAPTGTVQIQLDAAGRATYEFAANVAWDALQFLPDHNDIAAQADAVCFGTLGQRNAVSRATIQRFVESTPATCLRVFDVNLRQQFYDPESVLSSLKLANLLKLNDEELPIIASMCDIRGSVDEMLAEFRNRYDLQWVTLTRGERGAVLIGEESRSDFDGVATEVVDTVGAGDAFTAAMVIGLLRKQSLQSINERACQVAAFVCSQDGATPQLPRHLQSAQP
jgi:fructokinase